MLFFSKLFWLVDLFSCDRSSWLSHLILINCIQCLVKIEHHLEIEEGRKGGCVDVFFAPQKNWSNITFINLIGVPGTVKMFNRLSFIRTWKMKCYELLNRDPSCEPENTLWVMSINKQIFYFRYFHLHLLSFLRTFSLFISNLRTKTWHRWYFEEFPQDIYIVKWTESDWLDPSSDF